MTPGCCRVKSKSKRHNNGKKKKNVHLRVPLCRQAMVRLCISSRRPAAKAVWTKRGITYAKSAPGPWLSSLAYSSFSSRTACRWASTPESSQFISVSLTFLSSSLCPLPWFSPPTCSCSLVLYSLTALFSFRCTRAGGLSPFFNYCAVCREWRGARAPAGHFAAAWLALFFFNATGGPGKGSSLGYWAIYQEGKADRVHWAAGVCKITGKGVCLWIYTSKTIVTRVRGTYYQLSYHHIFAVGLRGDL